MQFNALMNRHAPAKCGAHGCQHDPLIPHGRETSGLPDPCSLTCLRVFCHNLDLTRHRNVRLHLYNCSALLRHYCRLLQLSGLQSTSGISTPLASCDIA